MAIELKELRREPARSADVDTTVPPPPSSKATEGALPPVSGQDAAMSVPTVSVSSHPSSAEYIVSGIKRHKTVALIALLIACVGLVYAVYRFAFQANLKVAHFQKMKITRVTTEGNVESARFRPTGSTSPIRWKKAAGEVFGRNTWEPAAACRSCRPVKP